MRVRDAVLAGACVVLLGPAALLTVLRLTEPPGAKAVQAVAFTPFAMPLYAAALVLLVVVMLVRRSVAVAYAVPAALAGAGLVLHVSWFAPLVVGDAPEPADDVGPVEVMTANVFRGEADGGELMGQVRDHGVDLLVVNEITVSFLDEMDAEGLADVLPFRAGNPGAEETVTGTMVFSNQPTRLIDSPDTTLDALVVDTGGLRLLAAHPMAPPWPDDWRDDHAVIREAVEEHTPDVLAGDFNATSDQAPMRALGDDGYRDSVELTNGGFQPTWPVNGTFGLLGAFGPVAQIDHVLVSDGWTVTASETTELGGSDHKPVVAVVAPR